MYPLLESVQYPQLQSVPPITKCTPYYKVYPLSQSIYRRPGFNCVVKQLRFWLFKVDCEYKDCDLRVLRIGHMHTCVIYTLHSNNCELREKSQFAIFKLRNWNPAYGTLIQSIPPITKCTPYHKVYPLLQSIPPITKCTPYRKVYTLIQSVPPITKCTPYHKVLIQSVPPITKCTPYYKVYPLLQTMYPITLKYPPYHEANIPNWQVCVPYVTKYVSY